MAWTATLRHKERVNGRLKLIVDFTDGINTSTEEYILNNPDSVNNLIGNTIKNLEALDSLETSLSLGAVTIAAPTPQTQAEKDAVAFLQTYNRWIKVKNNLIDTGILTGNETQVAALKTKVQTDFKPAYLNLL